MLATSSHSFQALEFCEQHNIPFSNPRVLTLQTLALEADRAQVQVEFESRHDIPSLVKLITDVLRSADSHASKDDASRYLATREKAMKEAANQIERLAEARGKLEGFVKLIDRTKSVLRAEAQLEPARRF